MAIPQAIPGQLIQFAHALGPYVTWQTPSAAVSSLESAFYASLRSGIMQGEKVINWLRETSIGHVNKIQILFNLANVGLIALSAAQLMQEVNKRCGFSVINAASQARGLNPAVGVAFAVAGVVFLGTKLVNRFSTPLAEPELIQQRDEVAVPIGVNEETRAVIVLTRETITPVNVAEHFSIHQRLAKVLHTTKLVLDVALGCFVQNRFWLVVSVAMSTYSLWKNIQLKWISVTRKDPCQTNNPQVPVNQLEVTYNILAIPSIKTDEECPVCFEPAADKIGFCARHVFCKSCLIPLASSKSKSFADGAGVSKIETRRYTNGVYTGTTYSYRVEVNAQENLPSCPTCREVPLQNGLGIKVSDGIHGEFDATVILKRPSIDRQYLFENLYAIYNSAQAALAFLQTYPELQVTIYKIQNFMLVTDLVGYGLTMFYLNKRINEKFNPNNSTKFKVATAAGAVLLGGLSYYVMTQINLYLKPVIIFGDLLKQSGISSNVLSSLNFSFHIPTLQKIAQVLLINRISASVALVFFSKQKKINLLSVATQLASLAGISMLKWIKVVHTLNEPLVDIVKNGGKLVGSGITASSVKYSQVSHYFLINSSCLAHLQSTLKSIADFAINFFNGSSWQRYWTVYYRNGFETRREITYSITLLNNAVNSCGCSLVPHLTDTAINVVDAWYGAAKLVIQKFSTI